MCLRWWSLLTCSINIRGRARGVINTRITWNHSRRSSWPNYEDLAYSRVAFHPYMCKLRRDATMVAAALIGYDDVKVAIGTTTQRRRLWVTTSSTPTCDYVGSLLQLFFRCSARLVVTTIYNPFTCKFSRCNSRYSVNIAYSFPYSTVCWVVVVFVLVVTLAV
jgi:hypothetical protein